MTVSVPPLPVGAPAVLHTGFPDADLGVGSNVDGHNGRYRYEWVIVSDGALVLRGFDVVTIGEHGLIERVDGFFGTLRLLELHDRAEGAQP